MYSVVHCMYYLYTSLFLFFHVIFRCVVVGVTGGAIIIYWLNAAGRKNALVIISVLFFMLPFMLVFFLHCPSIELAGVLRPYEDG